MNVAAVLTAMLPEHLLLAGIVALLIVHLLDHPRRNTLPLCMPLALLSVGAATLAATALAWQGLTLAPFAGHFSVTPQTLAVKAAMLALALPVLLMARHEFAGHEFGTLLLCSLYGICLLQSADSMLTLFLGLEIMSLPIYALVLLAYRRPQAAEAAIKYLVLGGTATAMLLMGAALAYGSSGSLALSAFAQVLAQGDGLARTACVLVLLSFFIKAAIVPFHGWAPDAYEAASVSVTAFMATLVKAGVMLALLRLVGGSTLAAPLLQIAALLPLASIVWGNLAAMRQASLRRIVAYSGIAHAGYLMLALLAAPALRLQTVAFYLLAYGLANLLALAALPADDDDTRRDQLEHLRGLARRSPAAALLVGASMLSLAGIPPLPGFVAKFNLFSEVLAAGHVGVAVAGLIGSYLGLYFYLRVIQVMFMDPPGSPAATPAPAGIVPNAPIAQGAALVCAAGTLLIAVLPGWVLAGFG